MYTLLALLIFTNEVPLMTFQAGPGAVLPPGTEIRTEWCHITRFRVTTLGDWVVECSEIVPPLPAIQPIAPGENP